MRRLETRLSSLESTRPANNAADMRGIIDGIRAYRNDAEYLEIVAALSAQACLADIDTSLACQCPTPKTPDPRINWPKRLVSWLKRKKIT